MTTSRTITSCEEWDAIKLGHALKANIIGNIR